MNSYAVVNQRTITVKVGVAPCSWTRVTNVAEAPTEVRVKVETLPCPRPGPGTAELALQDLTVSLAADLGTRVVEDANGQTVPLRTSESTSPAPGQYALPTFQATARSPELRLLGWLGRLGRLRGLHARTVRAGRARFYGTKVRDLPTGCDAQGVGRTARRAGRARRCADQPAHLPPHFRQARPGSTGRSAMVQAALRPARRSGASLQLVQLVPVRRDPLLAGRRECDVGIRALSHERLLDPD
jgi:hypothetical protein